MYKVYVIYEMNRFCDFDSRKIRGASPDRAFVQSEFNRMKDEFVTTGHYGWRLCFGMYHQPNQMNLYDNVILALETIDSVVSTNEENLYD